MRSAQARGRRPWLGRREAATLLVIVGQAMPLVTGASEVASAVSARRRARPRASQVLGMRARRATLGSVEVERDRAHCRPRER